jgi:hypothetical protein
MKLEKYTSFQFMGWILILLGVIFVTMPHITRFAPEIDRIPWWVIWVYRKDGLFFATSPLLIFISILSIVFRILRS